MEDVKKFILSLVEVGLYKARLVEDDREYVFSDNKFEERILRVDYQTIEEPVEISIDLDREEILTRKTNGREWEVSQKEEIEEYKAHRISTSKKLIRAAILIIPIVIAAFIFLPRKPTVEEVKKPIEEKINVEIPGVKVETKTGSGGNDVVEKQTQTGEDIPGKFTKKPEKDESYKEKEKLQSDRQYRAHLKRARDLFHDGYYDRALDSLAEASKWGNTPDLTRLEGQIRQAKKQSIQEKKEIKEVKPIETIKIVETIRMFNLSEGIRIAYNKKMSRVLIKMLNPRMRVWGRIVVNLAIDENGKLSVLYHKDKLKVVPTGAKKHIKMLILRNIKKISLIPPKNKNGETVRVSNWQITYKVRKLLNNKIILTKQ